ncbi:MAG: IS5 family transposase [Flavisolibacter sp.]|nr:IS5 family transposase [Flavisolibacter sp.]
MEGSNFEVQSFTTLTISFMSKDKYKVGNWSQYNQGLKLRGSITVWISQEVLEQWQYRGEKKKGGQYAYSDWAIEVCLTVHKVYHLPLRQTQGFIESFFLQMQLNLPVPCYTQISRRSQGLAVNLPTKTGKRITDIVVDSTGLKVYGEGEWKVRQHGWSKHRQWMKLHVGLDAQQQQAEAVELSTNAVDDAEMVDKLLKQTQGDIHSFTGDGAYDKAKVRKLLYEKAAEQKQDIFQCIPPQRGAVMDKKGREHLWQRNDDIKAMKRLGRKEWKVLSNYHQRSKAETFMYRYKTILGGQLMAREFSRQRTEVKVGCKILNIMLQMAKPQSQKVA